jgi:hypothetical protein
VSKLDLKNGERVVIHSLGFPGEFDGTVCGKSFESQTTDHYTIRLSDESRKRWLTPWDCVDVTESCLRRAVVD